MNRKTLFAILILVAVSVVAAQDGSSTNELEESLKKFLNLAGLPFAAIILAAVRYVYKLLYFLATKFVIPKLKESTSSMAAVSDGINKMSSDISELSKKVEEISVLFKQNSESPGFESDVVEIHEVNDAILSSINSVAQNVNSFEKDVSHRFDMHSKDVESTKNQLNRLEPIINAIDRSLTTLVASINVFIDSVKRDMF